MRLGMLKDININSGLNIYGTVVISDPIALKLWRFDKMISKFWAYFHCACAQTAIWELLWPDLQRIIKVLLVMSYLAYDNWNLLQTYDNGRGIFRKSYIITENQTNVFDA